MINQSNNKGNNNNSGLGGLENNVYNYILIINILDYVYLKKV